MRDEKNFESFKEGAVDARDGVAFVTLSGLGVVGEGVRPGNAGGEEDLLGLGVVSSGLGVGSGGMS